VDAHTPALLLAGGQRACLRLLLALVGVRLLVRLVRSLSGVIGLSVAAGLTRLACPVAAVVTSGRALGRAAEALLRRLMRLLVRLLRNLLWIRGSAGSLRRL